MFLSTAVISLTILGVACVVLCAPVPELGNLPELVAAAKLLSDSLTQLLNATEAGEDNNLGLNMHTTPGTANSGNGDINWGSSDMNYLPGTAMNSIGNFNHNGIGGTGRTYDFGEGTGINGDRNIYFYGNGMTISGK